MSEQGFINIPISQEVESAYHQVFLNIAKEAFEQARNEVGTPRYMTKKQAAAYIGISYNSLQLLIVEGMPMVNINSKQLIDREDLHEFLTKRKTVQYK